MASLRDHLGYRVGLWATRVTKGYAFFLTNTVGRILVITLERARKYFDVRVSWFDGHRFGHLIHDAAWEFARGQSNSRRENLTVYCFNPNRKISNQYLRKLVARNFFVMQVVWWAISWAQHQGLSPDWLRSPRSLTKSSTYDAQGLILCTSERLEMRKREQRRCRNLLMGMGWDPDQPFVCLHIRDNEFHREIKPHTLPQEKEDLQMRNSRFSDFIPAVEWLTDRDIFVLRTGKKMEKIGLRRSNFVDYASSADRADMLDFWLFSNCAACYSTGSGPDAISKRWQRPVLQINHLPVIDNYASGDVSVAGKKIHGPNGLLNLEQHLSANFGGGREFRLEGLRIEPLASTEIMEIISEHWFETTLIPEEVRGENGYEDIYRTSLKRFGHPENATWIHRASRISAAWARIIERESANG